MLVVNNQKEIIPNLSGAVAIVSTMDIDRQRYMIWMILLFGLVFSLPAFAQGYTIARVPSWVNYTQTPASDQADQQNNSNGVAYLLVDHQWRVNEGQQSHHQHFVNKALNTSGVSEASQISIDYDPVYESVVLHQIMIHRDGRIIDRVDRSRINLIQREKDLEYQIYDGSKTLNVFIEDVRVGDSVEYSYTIEGANPVFAGHFSENLKMRWEVPVSRVHYRVLWSDSRPLRIRNHETGIEPVKRTSGQYTEYIWSQDKVEELVSDKDTPSWYAPFPVVYLSDINSWDEVAAWAWPLYQPRVNSPAQKAIIDPILKTANTVEQRVLAALRFVQDEVRYLGIEMGVRSHKPNAPDAVIEQRFGDCKDKSRLLVSLLQGMGIEASSALVNTYSGERAINSLPTPTVFNHAIVLARANGKNYWLDPTRTHQSGSLDTVYQPDYDYALVVSDQGSDPIKMSDDITARHSKVVKETFDIRDAIDKPATYQILSHHERYYADSLREQLSETNANQIQQSFLNYTAHYYSDIQVAGKIKIVDDERLNRLTLTEQYTIPEIWSKSDDDRYILVGFEPYLINDYVKNVAEPIRTMPYSVTHPVHYQHTTRILVPEGSSFEKEYHEVVDKSFRFTKKVGFSDNVLVLDYVYESLNDHVMPEDILAHSKNIRAVQSLNNFQIQMTNPAIKLGQYGFDNGDVNWPVVIVFLLALAVSIFVFIKYIFLYDPPYQAPSQVNTRLEGLTGWLVIPGLAVIVNPIKIVLESVDLLYIFSALQWSIVEDQFGMGLLITVVVEMIFNVAMAVMSIFLIVMFFTRRHTFPRVFIAYLVFTLAMFGADLLVLHLLSYPGVEVESSDIRELMHLLVNTTIWSLYFIKSERVKATFTRQHNHAKPLQYAVDANREVILQDVS